MNSFITGVAGDAMVPVALIEQIIAAIMNIISQCNPTPAPTPAEVKGGSFRSNTSIYRGMLMNGVRPNSAQGKAIMDSMQKRLPSLADTDAADFLAQCGVIAVPTPAPTEMPKA